MANECVGCGSTRRRLRSVSNKLRDEFWTKRKLIIKHCQKICQNCAEQRHLFLFKTQKFNKNHSLSQKWLERIQHHQHKSQQQIQLLKQKIKKQQDEIDKLKKKHIKNTRYARIKPVKDEEYETERQLIPQQASSKWTNHLQYELLAESDCQYFTGFSRSKIIKQAKKCSTRPELVFQLRVRFKHYLPKQLQSQIFGWSATNLTKYMDTTLDLMHQKYAKPMLVNSQKSAAQYQTRDRIKKNTPKFAYRLREIDETEDKIIVLCDSTYQYVDTVQSCHDIRKKTTNMHKYRKLIKNHIFSCANGQPIYGLCVFGDGYHADGPIFESILNKAYVEKCEKAIKENNVTEEIAFKTLDVCSELKHLQQLLQPQDHCIVDNGYKIFDPRKKAPNDGPADDDQDGQITVLAAAQKRSLTAIRQTEERVNKYVKRNKMCRTQIHCEDIHRIPKVWDICLADMVHENIVLMKDDDNSNALTERILDARHVATNPADFWWNDKKKKKKKAKDKDDKDDEMDIDLEESDLVTKDDDDCKENEEFTEVANGWSHIVDYISADDFLKHLFKDVDFGDIVNYCGKHYQNGLAKGYLRRMNFEEKGFCLKKHKVDENVYLIKNMKSKWKSSKRYEIILCFHEVDLWQRSLKMHLYAETTINVPKDEEHWLLWLKNGKQNKVSEFLSEKYVNREKELEKRRIKRIKRRKSGWCANQNISKMNKGELEYFAEEHNINHQSQITRAQLFDLIKNHFKEKSKNKSKKMNESNKTKKKCGSCNKENPKNRCSKCKIVLYCNATCQHVHWNLIHKKQCKTLQKQKSKPTPPIQSKNKKDASIPKSLSYLKKYPKKKSWYDLNFTLFDSKLARVQIRCNCKSGVQIPGCCAHASSGLWLFYYILRDDINKLLKTSKRDAKILENIVDLEPWNKHKKTMKKDDAYWCYCKTEKDEGWVECDCCNRWYHPSCVGTTMDDINIDKATYNLWHCSFCDGNSAFVVRNI